MSGSGPPSCGPPPSLLCVKLTSLSGGPPPLFILTWGRLLTLPLCCCVGHDFPLSGKCLCQQREQEGGSARDPGGHVGGDRVVDCLYSVGQEVQDLPD